MGGSIKDTQYSCKDVNSIYIFNVETQMCEERKNTGIAFSSEGNNAIAQCPNKESKVIALVGTADKFTPAIIEYSRDSSKVEVIKTHLDMAGQQLEPSTTISDEDCLVNDC